MSGMWFAFFVTTLLSSAIADNEFGIVGGHDINITEAPYQIGLFVHESSGPRQFQCSGSIISTKIVISGASCLLGLPSENSLVVLVGSARLGSGNIYNVTKFVSHPKFSGGVFDYDVALLLLEKNLELNEKIAIVPLANKGAEIPTNKETFISGWGTLDVEHFPKNLQGVKIPAVAKEVCEKFTNAPLNPRTVCVYAEGKSTCYGDGGSPLVYNGSLYGIATWMVGQCDGPSGFTKVSALRDWIDKTVKDLTSGNI